MLVAVTFKWDETANQYALLKPVCEIAYKKFSTNNIGFDWFEGGCVYLTIYHPLVLSYSFII